MIIPIKTRFNSEFRRFSPYSEVPYDFLAITAGLQDAALNSLKIRTWGLDHLTQGYRRVNGAMSSADPNLRN